MRLSEAGVARVRGYMFALERSLQSRLPKHVARAAAAEIGTHINAPASPGIASGAPRSSPR